MVSVHYAFRGIKRQEPWVGFLLVLPALVMSVSVFLIPFLITLPISLYDINLAVSSQYQGYVGFKHYIAFFTYPPSIRILWYTLEFLLICLPSIIVGAFILANLLRKNLTLKGMFRTFNILPWVVSGVAAGFMFRWVFNEVNGGLVNGVLRLIGIGKVRFLSDPSLNLLVLMVCIIWKTIPFAFIVLLSGMQSIPSDYYEAAEIDGGGAFAKIRYITIPFLMGHFRILAVVITIGLLGGSIDVMRTIGGTGDFKVIGYAMYLQAFSSAGLSYGAAMGAIMLFIAILLTLVYNKFLRLDAMKS